MPKMSTNGAHAHGDCLGVVGIAWWNVANGYLPILIIVQFGDENTLGTVGKLGCEGDLSEVI